MKVNVPEALFHAAREELSQFTNQEAFRFKKYTQLDLESMSDRRMAALVDACFPHRNIKGVSALLKDVASWQKANDGKAAVSRTVERFSILVKLLLQKTPGHRVYNRAEAGVYFGYYVNEINYRPPVNTRHERTPAHCVIELIYEELGEKREATETFWAVDCVGISPETALARKDLFVETPELRSAYLAETERYFAVYDKVGMQMLARGVGSDNLDGNERRGDSWFWRSTKEIVFDHLGEPARVVVDVFKEDDSKASDGSDRVKPSRVEWIASKTVIDDDEDDSEEPEDSEPDREEMPDDDEEDTAAIEVPIHPMVAVFDLRRHIRLRTHVGNLTDYKYDTSVQKRLILPEEIGQLVEMLIVHNGAFTDIISGKGGGSIILCAGGPGTGKTLTAEVYAEAMSRPLYSVQCSQLGVSPNDLEEELLKVFARSRRWKSILLLDEADVYVASRGNDMDQNAIVGVFLRVLEYYSGVLFLTTNRADKVDDAVASRCIARIDYKIPTIEDQRRIWRVLADSARIPLSDAEITKIAKMYASLSGRDIKNLLKLASLVAASRKTKVTADTVKFVKRFKPTGDLKEQQ